MFGSKHSSRLCIKTSSPGEYLPELRVKSHEVSVKRVFVVFPDEECAGLFVEVKHATSQPSLARYGSQRLQYFDVRSKPDTKRSLIRSRRNLFGFLSQLIHFIFTTVTVNARPTGKVLRKLLLVSAKLVPSFPRQTLEKLLETPGKLNPAMFVERGEVPLRENAEFCCGCFAQIRVSCQPCKLSTVGFTTLKTTPQRSSQQLAVRFRTIPDESSLNKKQLANRRLKKTLCIPPSASAGSVLNAQSTCNPVDPAYTRPSRAVERNPDGTSPMRDRNPYPHWGPRTTGSRPP